MAKQTLLLVDNDRKSLRVMEVSLRNAGYLVKTARDGAEALEKLKNSRPDLIISDVSLPKVDGFALCSRVKGDHALADVPFIFLTEASSGGSVEAKVRGLEPGADDYLTKPIYIKEVTARVRMALMRRARQSLERDDHRRFFGDLRDMGIVDLLQMFEMGNKSGVLRLPRGDAMWFRDGQVIDAKAGTLQGEEAIYRLLNAEEGDFEIDFRTPERPDVIDKSTQSLLIEGMRRIDEWARLCEQLPPLETAFQVDYGELSERQAGLPLEVNDLLRAFDGTHSARAVIDGSPLPDLAALAAISRLYFEGIIYEVRGDAQPEPAPEPAAVPDLGSWLSDGPGAVAPVAVDSKPPADLPLSVPPLGELPLAGAATLDELDSRPTRRVAIGSARPEPRRSLVESLIAQASPPPERRVVEAPDDGLDDGLDDEPTRPRMRAHPPRRRVHETPVSAVPSLAGEPSGAVHDSDTEASFYDRPERDDDDDFDFGDATSEPLSPAAWVAISLVVAGLIAGVSFLTLRDSVDPMSESRAALSSSWHKKILSARPKLESPAPIEGDWTLPSTAPSDAPAPPTPAEPDPVAPSVPEPPAPTTAEPKAAAPKDAPPPAEVAAKPAGDVDGLVRQAVSLHNRGDYRGAAQVYEKALKIQPNNDKVLVGYAKALLERGRDKQALKAARRAAKANSRNHQAFLIIGSVMQDLGKKEAAIEAYERFLKLAPRSPFAADVRSIMQGMK